MPDLFLIAHKVRGSAAFDVATQMPCPHCNGEEGTYDEASMSTQECHECDSLGFWWIIPTSGHRAYPWWSASLEAIGTEDHQLDFEHVVFETDKGPGPMPNDIADHYTTRAAPRIDLAEALGLRKPAAAPPPLPRRL